MYLQAQHFTLGIAMYVFMLHMKLGYKVVLYI